MTPDAPRKESPHSLAEARKRLDQHTREIVKWHFDPKTGCPFWLEYAKKLGWDPRKEIRSYDDLDKFPFFEDEWLRGGPVRRWVPLGFLNLQPSELMKVACVLYAASFTVRKQDYMHHFGKGFMPMAVVMEMIGALLFSRRTSAWKTSLLNGT